MIAHMKRGDGEEARFHLPALTIPPFYIMRRGRLYACQPDYKLPEGNREIVARYVEAYCPNIDNYAPMNEAQITEAETDGYEYPSDDKPSEEPS